MGIEFGQVLKSVKVTTRPGTPGTEGPTSPPDPIRGYRLTMERIPMVASGPVVTVRRCDEFIGKLFAVAFFKYPTYYPYVRPFGLPIEYYQSGFRPLG